MVKLIHYNNSLMLSELVRCAAIEIKYVGKFIGESKLSDDWYVGTGLNRIICISLTGNQNIDELFEFEGAFTVLGTKMITESLDEIYLEYLKIGMDTFGKSREKWESGGSYFSDYNSIHQAIDTAEQTDIYKNNLFTKQDEFFYEDGENYFGDYHQHSNGQAMTESIHNANSVNIYRKDNNNKLYKPKSKRLRRIHVEDETVPLRDQGRKYNVKTHEQADSSQSTGTSGGGGSGGY